LDVGRLSGVYFVNSDTGWVVGRAYPGIEELILKTTDGGDVWFRQDSGLGNQLFSVFFADDQHGWAAGEGGTILATTNGGVTFVRSVNVLPSQYVLYQNYPNPFNPLTTINYDLPEEAVLSLKVFDILGKEVLLLVDGTVQAGHHSVTLDANKMASGLYFYRLTTRAFTAVKKLVVVK
jgi:hypothetical protein